MSVIALFPQTVYNRQVTNYPLVKSTFHHNRRIHALMFKPEPLLTQGDIVEGDVFNVNWTRTCAFIGAAREGS